MKEKCFKGRQCLRFRRVGGYLLYFQNCVWKFSFNDKVYFIISLDFGVIVILGQGDEERKIG